MFLKTSIYITPERTGFVYYGIRFPHTSLRFLSPSLPSITASLPLSLLQSSIFPSPFLPLTKPLPPSLWYIFLTCVQARNAARAAAAEAEEAEAIADAADAAEAQQLAQVIAKLALLCFVSFTLGRVRVGAKGFGQSTVRA